MTRFFIATLIALACIAGLIGVAIGLFLLTTPRPTNIRDCFTTSMFHVRLCPREPGYVRLHDISPAARAAVIVSEDGAFYSHQGIDWFELRESFEKNWQRGEFARGGSTITQQLAKNVYLTQEKSILRKAREAIIAVQLESLLSKDEILEKYFNVVEFGPHLYGIGRASQFYFNKSPALLTAAEGAFLAFLLPSPDRYGASFRKRHLSPFARSRMNQIVGRMYKFRKISEPEYDEALREIMVFFGEPASAGPAVDEMIEPSAEEQPPGELPDATE